MEEMYENDFNEVFTEPWMNTACLGYAVTALDNLGYEPEKITEVVMELKELFDWLTVEDADEAYKASDY